MKIILHSADIICVLLVVFAAIYNGLNNDIQLTLSYLTILIWIIRAKIAESKID